MKKIYSLFSVTIMAVMVFGACSKNSKPGPGPEPDPDAKFEISVSDITGSCATVSVSSSEVLDFYFDVIELDEYLTYSSDKEFVDGIVADLKETAELLSDLGITFADFLSYKTDLYEYECSFTPNTQYIAYAFGCNTSGTVTSPLEITLFETGAPKPSNNTFSFMEDAGYITITPSVASDYYMYTLEPKSDIASMTDAQIISLVLAEAEEYGIGYYVTKNVVEEDWSDALEVGTDYTIVAFGYDGAATTKLYKYDFTFEGQGGGGEGYSTLTSNVSVTNVQYAEAVYYGDFYDTGTGNWTVYLDSANCGIQVELFKTLGYTDVAGSFTVDQTFSGAVNTIFPGFLDEEGYMYGAWYYTLDSQGNIDDPSATAEEGTAVLTKSGSTYTIKVNLKDMNGYSMTCDYTGTLTIQDYSESSASVLSKKNSKVDLLKKFSSVYKKQVRSMPSKVSFRESKNKLLKKLHTSLDVKKLKK